MEQASGRAGARPSGAGVEGHSPLLGGSLARASSAAAHRRRPLPPRGQPRTHPLAVPAVTHPVAAPARANRAVLPHGHRRSRIIPAGGTYPGCLSGNRLSVTYDNVDYQNWTTRMIRNTLGAVSAMNPAKRRLVNCLCAGVASIATAAVSFTRRPSPVQIVLLVITGIGAAINARNLSGNRPRVTYDNVDYQN